MQDVASKKRPAVVDGPAPLRPSARTAAISKRVHAAAKAAEAARESSARGGTSSAFTAATALSKNVAQLSDSTQHARPTTRSGKAGTAVSHAMTSGGRVVEAGGNESAELPKSGDRGLPEPGRTAVEETTVVRETRSRKKAAEVEPKPLERPAGSAAETAGVTSQPNVDVSPHSRSALEGTAGPATESAGATLQPNADADGACEQEAPLAEKGRSTEAGTAIGAAVCAEESEAGRAGQGAREESEETRTTEAVEANGPPEAPGKHRGDVSLQARDGTIDGQEATGSGAKAPQQPAAEAGVDLDRQTRPAPDAAAPSTSHVDGKEAQRSRGNEELPDGMEVDPQAEKQSDAVLQDEDGANGPVHEEADEQDEDAVSAEATDDSQKAWQVFEGTVQGESLKRRLPEMTVSELRARQSFPSNFSELVSLWPRKELEQQPVSLLTIAVDAGIWSPPPFYRGKRPRLR